MTKRASPSKEYRPLIIGLAGKRRSGKGEVCRILAKSGIVEISFAAPMKETVTSLFSLEPDACYNQKKKETILPRWGVSPRDMLQVVGTECFQFAFPKALRRLGRRPTFGRDVWVQICLERLSRLPEKKRPKVVILGDLRFPHEARAIRKAGGLLWRLDRKAVAPKYWLPASLRPLERALRGLLGLQRVEDHPSETALDTWKDWDAVIPNDGTLEELKNNVKVTAWNSVGQRVIGPKRGRK